LKCQEQGENRGSNPCPKMGFECYQVCFSQGPGHNPLLNIPYPEDGKLAGAMEPWNATGKEGTTPNKGKYKGESFF